MGISVEHELARSSQLNPGMYKPKNDSRSHEVDKTWIHCPINWRFNLKNNNKLTFSKFVNNLKRHAAIIIQHYGIQIMQIYNESCCEATSN